jgi:hypothetical protein
MSRNGSGIYTLPAGNPVVTGTTISSTWANNTLNDIAATLTDSVAADGQTPMTGDLDLNGNQIKNLANGTLPDDAASVTQVTTNVAITGGSITGITDLAVADGGTGASTFAANAVLLGNGASSFQTVAPSTAGNILTSNGTTWVSSAAGVGFAAGTVILFYQAAAPTGWTKVTTQDNKALRVVSGTGGVAGGTTAFTSVFTNQTVSTSISVSGTTGATTLSTSQMPSHSHSKAAGSGGDQSSGFAPIQVDFTGSTSAEGGGGSHTHSFSGSGSGTSSAVTLNVQYIDIILCSKN